MEIIKFNTTLKTKIMLLHYNMNLKKFQVFREKSNCISLRCQ